MQHTMYIQLRPINNFVVEMKQFFILFHLSFSLVVQTVLVFSQCVGNYIIIIILL